MKLHVLSDLHLRYQPLKLAPVAADIVMLVGDINRGTAGVEWAHRQFPGQRVLYVLGNHEFYRGCVQDITAACQAVAAHGDADIRILQDSEYVTEGVAFLGATLWTQFDFFGPEKQAEAISKVQRLAPDYKVIRTRALNGCQRVMEPIDTQRWCTASRDWLRQRIRHHRELGNRICVATHFAPSRGSLSTRFADDVGSAYFVNPFDDWLAREGPDLWLHGHTHDGFDYHVGNTRVVCNARGYPGERDETPTRPFHPALTVEI